MSSDYSENRIKELEEELKNKSVIIEEYSKYIEELKADLEFRTEYLNKKIDDITANYKKASSDYLEIKNSSSWRMTKLFRKTFSFLRDFRRNHVKVCAFLQLLKCFFIHGPKSMAILYAELKQNLFFSKLQKIGFNITADEMKRQQEAKFSRSFKISIITSLCNTSRRHLRAMLDSVKAQTYIDWELCIADCSDDQHSYIGKICKEYSRKDGRIRYIKLESGTNVSRSTDACIEMAAGEYLSLLGQDDVLHPYTLFEIMKAACDRDADFIYTDETSFCNTPKDAFKPFYKPDFAPDTLCGTNYIHRLFVFKRELIGENAGFAPEYDGAQEYDLVLRLSVEATNIVHIHQILYYVRKPDEREENTEYASGAGRKAVESHIERLGFKAHVESVKPGMPIYKVQYDIKADSRVSILIPNSDHTDDLRKCIDSIFSKTSYTNYEIVIIENNSTTESVFNYYEQLKSEHDNIKIVTWKGKFNYSAINNFGTKYCSGDYFLFLNNDTEVISTDWIEQMLMYAQRDDVGAVGAKLYYPGDTIQHAGIGLGLLDLVGPIFKDMDRNDFGYMGRLLYSQNVSAVTAACMMVPKVVWENLSGFDESFKVALNDVDLCMRIRREGLLIVWTPFAELYHYESKSRGMENTVEKRKRFENECFKFRRQWAKELAEGDPYVNPKIFAGNEDYA